MSPDLASIRVAIIGAGPSGFYAAEALQKDAPGITIDLFDRLPTPFGLVRGGVAPDHGKIKTVTRIYDRIAAQPGFRFFGNVTVGRDITVDQLRDRYDAVLVSTGAQTDRHLDIPGESLRGSHAATDLVGWYNGHPDYVGRSFDLSQRAAAVVGMGNVAIDVSRILLKSPDALAPTDLVSPALDALRRSAVETVYILARRGPVQAACTTTELREMGELDGVDAIVDPAELELDSVSAAHLASGTDRTAQKNMDVFRSWASRSSTGAPRKVIFRFGVSPVAIDGTGHVDGLRIVRNELVPDGNGSVKAVATTATEQLDVGLVFRSVGYRGVPIPGLPFDERRGVIPNEGGRVVSMQGGDSVPGLYVCGWIKRGPSGVIGTNKSCAADTVALLIDDVMSGVIAPGREDPDMDRLLAANGVGAIGWSDWQALDRIELDRGASASRAREKVLTQQEMLDLIHRARAAS